MAVTNASATTLVDVNMEDVDLGDAITYPTNTLAAAVAVG